LRAIDIAAFHSVANEVLALANKDGWRIRSIQRQYPGGNILQIEIAPATSASSIKSKSGTLFTPNT
jgi:hypothetical protein